MQHILIFLTGKQCEDNRHEGFPLHSSKHYNFYQGHLYSMQGPGQNVSLGSHCSIHNLIFRIIPKYISACEVW